PDMGDWAAVDVRTPGQTGELQRDAVHALGDHAAARSLTGPRPPLPESSRSALARALRSAQPVGLDADALAERPEAPL
ncbi:SpoIIE family protein phosphatase, partial [Streptomyces flavovirens]